MNCYPMCPQWTTRYSGRVDDVRLCGKQFHSNIGATEMKCLIACSGDSALGPRWRAHDPTHELNAATSAKLGKTRLSARKNTGHGTARRQTRVGQGTSPISTLRA